MASLRRSSKKRYLRGRHRQPREVIQLEGGWKWASPSPRRHLKRSFPSKQPTDAAQAQLDLREGLRDRAPTSLVGLQKLVWPHDGDQAKSNHLPTRWTQSKVHYHAVTSANSEGQPIEWTTDSQKSRVAGRERWSKRHRPWVGNWWSFYQMWTDSWRWKDTI